MARIVVTGSRGFVGTHLTRELRARGHHVLGCDLTHAEDEISFSIEGDLKTSRYIRCDISEYDQLFRLFTQMDAEYVFNLAGEFGRHNGADFIRQVWTTNVVGTRYVLNFQRRFGFKLIHFSTSEVYGDYPSSMAEDVVDLHEVKQLGDYAISKWVNELQIGNMARQYGTESVIVRLFNVYGPGEYYSPYRSALCRFAYCALKGLPLTVYRGHRRSWLYVDDLVRTLANIPERFKPGETYNLGNEQSVSMEALAELMLSHVGASPALLQLDGHEPMTTRQKQVDCSKARDALDHRCEVSLGEGVARTLSWMRNIYG